MSRYRVRYLIMIRLGLKSAPFITALIDQTYPHGGSGKFNIRYENKKSTLFHHIFWLRLLTCRFQLCVPHLLGVEARQQENSNLLDAIIGAIFTLTKQRLLETARSEPISSSVAERAAFRLASEETRQVAESQ